MVPMIKACSPALGCTGVPPVLSKAPLLKPSFAELSTGSLATFGMTASYFAITWPARIIHSCG